MTERVQQACRLFTLLLRAAQRPDSRTVQRLSRELSDMHLTDAEMEEAQVPMVQEMIDTLRAGLSPMQDVLGPKAREVLGRALVELGDNYCPASSSA